MCKAEESGGLSWPETASGETAVISCEAGKVGSITRDCVNGQWGAVKNSCGTALLPSLYI